MKDASEARIHSGANLSVTNEEDFTAFRFSTVTAPLGHVVLKGGAELPFQGPLDDAQSDAYDELVKRHQWAEERRKEYLREGAVERALCRAAVEGGIKEVKEEIFAVDESSVDSTGVHPTTLIR
jgi:hypothetical protein